AMSGANDDDRAHRMRQRENRRRTVGQHDVVHEGLEIRVVLGKIADMPLEWITERALRMPLTAPVECCNGKAPRAQIANCLEIFFDEFGAAAEQTHRALAAGGRRPTRESQRNPVRGLYRAGHYVFRHRIGWNRDEFHWRGYAPPTRTD